MKREPLLIRDNHSIRKIDEVYMVTREKNGRKDILYHAPAANPSIAWDNACAAFAAYHDRPTPSRSEMRRWGWKCELISLCVETPIPNLEDNNATS